MADASLLHQKLKASSLHVLVSILVLASCSYLLLWLWYPYPYRALSGGSALLKLILGIDIVAGPLLTLFVYHPAKRRAALWLDFSVIGLLQIAALGYGLSIAASARPVHLVFEKDLFRIAHANEVRTPSDEPVALPWTGPTLKTAKLPDDVAARNQILDDALNKGVFEAYRSELWQPYESAREQVLAAAQPVARLTAASPAAALSLSELQADGVDIRRLRYLPVVGRDFATWTVLLDPDTALPVIWLPLDPSATLSNE
ncbi:pilus assembly protein [Lysobacteraceae bacterium NML07-0707]|nr:pilus assembly protein [Xanthomonadaceae bacterium NML07-0707]